MSSREQYEASQDEPYEAAGAKARSIEAALSTLRETSTIAGSYDQKEQNYALALLVELDRLQVRAERAEAELAQARDAVFRGEKLREALTDIVNGDACWATGTNEFTCRGNWSDVKLLCPICVIRTALEARDA